MSKATVKTVTTESILLELTKEEAGLLIKILGNIAGDGSDKTDYYQLATNVCTSLRSVGVEYPDRPIEFKAANWMSFVRVRG